MLSKIRYRLVLGAAALVAGIAGWFGPFPALVAAGVLLIVDGASE